MKSRKTATPEESLERRQKLSQALSDAPAADAMAHYQRILIVDDSESFRRQLSQFLDRPDRQIEVAHNAAVALNLLLKHPFSVAFIDLLMPGMSGQDLIREIRRRGLPVAVIVMTGDKTLDAVVTALENGADDYVRKPFPAKRLEAIISQAIKARELHGAGGDQQESGKSEGSFDRIDSQLLADALESEDTDTFLSLVDDLPEMGLKAKAAFLSGGIKEKTARLFVAVAIKALSHPDESCAYAAFEALRILAPEATVAIAPLIAALDDKDIHQVRAVMDLLAKFGPSASEAGPALVRLARDEHPMIRHTAYQALVPIFIPILKDFEYDRDNPYGIGLLQAVERYLGLSSPPEYPPTPPQYDALSQELAAENHRFREALAKRLEPALNAHIQAMPHDTYEQKKELARWVNEELRRFDLAIKCPKTGHPSILLAGPGNHPESGRFIIEHKTPEGKRVRSVISNELPHLELMEADPRREAIKEWREKVGRQPGGASRA